MRGKKLPWKDRLYGINSEGDLYAENNEKCRTKLIYYCTKQEEERDDVRAMIALWERFMAHFRNWESGRKPKGSFSDTTGFDDKGSPRSLCCVMPNGYISKADGKPRAWLELEYSSRADSRLQRKDGPSRAELKSGLHAMVDALSEAYPDLNIFVNEESRGYFTVGLVGTEEQADALYEAVLMAVEMQHGDQVLADAHEWIG